MSQTQEYIVRVEGTFDSYGLGTEVAPGCTLFKDGDYHLTKQELNQRLAKATPVLRTFRVKGDTEGLPQGRQ